MGWIKVSKRGGHVLQWEVSNLAIDAITSQDAELSVGLSSSGSALVSFADNYWTLNNGGNYCASRMCTSASDLQSVTFDNISCKAPVLWQGTNNVDVTMFFFH